MSIEATEVGIRGKEWMVEAGLAAYARLATGSAGGNRTGAWCISPIGGDLSCAMVRGGWAARWNRYWKDHKCPTK